MRLGKFIADKFPFFLISQFLNIKLRQQLFTHATYQNKEAWSWYTKSMNLGPFQKVFSVRVYVTKFALKTIRLPLLSDQ